MRMLLRVLQVVMAVRVGVGMVVVREYPRTDANVPVCVRMGIVAAAEYSYTDASMPVCGVLGILAGREYSRTDANVPVCVRMGIVAAVEYPRTDARRGSGKPSCRSGAPENDQRGRKQQPVVCRGCSRTRGWPGIPSLVRMTSMKTWIRGARLKTLPLAIAPVIIGTALSWKSVFVYSQDGGIPHESCPFFGSQHDLGEMKYGSLAGACQTSPAWFVLVAVLCGCVALFLQVAANFANDYSDGVRGTDEGRDAGKELVRSSRVKSVCTGIEGREADVDQGHASVGTLPIHDTSHGPARLVASGVNPKKVLAAAGINALVACLCGLAVCALTGYWWFILLGLACLLAGWCYVGGRHPYGYHYLGEVFVFVFFGLVATCGTMFALTGTVSASGIWGGCAVGCVAVAVLCANNLRDVESDRKHGKHTWMSALGWPKGTVFTIALMVVSAIMSMRYCVVMLRNMELTNVLTTGVALASVAMLFVVCIAAVAAIARKNYRTALPLCSLSSLALAAVFAMSSILS